MRSERFFKDERLPFAEVRYSRESSAAYKPHIHQCLSIGAIEKGSVDYQIGEATITLAPGSLAIVNPEVLHACNTRGKNTRSYYMLFLDRHWCRRVQQSLWNVTSFIKPEATLIDDRTLYQRYCSTMDLLIEEGVHLQEKEERLYELCCTIFTRSCRPQQALDKRESEHIEKLKNLLREDLQNDLPLDTLAAHFATNPYSLIRHFKQETGITPHAYRMNCRIEYAKKLLREKRDIADTASECGFFDQSHFHRHFKAITTVTPREYLLNFVQ